MNFSFKELKKNLKKDFTGFSRVRVAILADTASQLFSQALRGYGFTQQLDIDIWEAEYDQIQQTVIDHGSALYSFKPDFVIIYKSSGKLLSSFYNTAVSKASFAEDNINFLRDIADTLTARLGCKIIIINFPEINDSVFGNFANKVQSSFLYQQRRINYELMNLAQQISNLYISDLSAIQNAIGRTTLIDTKFEIMADNAVEIDALGFLVKGCTDIICAVIGKFKKCLILDLDNTLWGGIIGDDGMDRIEIGDLGIGKAFTGLQKWIKQLKERGIILAVSSKNTEHIAKEPFEKHPDMVLKIKDIAVFAANWNNKVDNIKYIQSILNIGFDSMVFLDDNPFEREMVRTGIPALTVPDLPEDPTEYLPYLYSLNLFETASFTAEDKTRNDQYREEASRAVLLNSFENEEDFLASLDMKADVKPVDSFTLPRAAQLTQRSNQFNLRTVRYSDDQIKSIAADTDAITLTINLKDKFGDYGLISLVIAKKISNDELFIDTWIMSCRVLKRGVERFVLNEIVKSAAAKGFKKITGEYLVTPKNGLVKDHYHNLGFIGEGEQFTLQIEVFKEINTHIKLQEK